MTVLAQFTAPAGHRRIDRDSLAHLQRLMQAIPRIDAHSGHLAHKFMSQDERAADAGIADDAGFVHVQIAAADADRLDVEDDLAGLRRWRTVLCLNADVFWPI